MARQLLPYGTFIIFLVASGVQAQVLMEPDAPTASRLVDLESRLKILEERARPETPRPEFKLANPDEQFSSLGPSASKIYFTTDTTAWGLSSELLSFSERRGLDGTSKNVNRLNTAHITPSFGAHLHKRVLFNSQILIENGGAESSNTVALQKGQVVLLSGYVDWFSGAQKDMGLRLGHQLVPIGWVNTRNEPLTYLSVLKPELERELIPSPWHENGVLFWIQRPRAEVEFGVFNSLDAKGFRAGTFLSGGRGNGQNAPAEDFMGVLRIQLKGPSIRLGGSMAAGPTAQGNESYLRGTFSLAEAHLRIDSKRVRAFAQIARGELSDADAISVINSSVIGGRAQGKSLEISVRPWLGKDGPLWLFVRRSEYDLHDQIPYGLTRDDSLHKTVTTTGASYRPLPNWVIKADYAFKKSARDDEEDEFNLGTGLSF